MNGEMVRIDKEEVAQAKCFTAHKSGAVVAILSRIREMPCSNFVRGTNCSVSS
jgi:hypothetical protein